MKKMLGMMMMIAILLIAITMGSTCALALAEAPYFDVVKGQKVMLGDISDIVEYLSCLTRQQLLDLAVIDRGRGQFYARVLPGQLICTWDDGSEISAYDLSENMQEYRVLRNLMLLVEDSSGDVLIKEGMKKLAFLDDASYPELVYSEEERALVAECILAEAYPDVDAFGTLSVANGFRKQGLFRALVLTCEYSKVHQDTVYFLAWKVVERSQLVAAPTKKPLHHHSSDDETWIPEKTPAPRPTDKPEPENNPRPTEDTTRPGEPENNPRPTEFVPSGDGDRSDDPDPFTGGSNTGNGEPSSDPDPFNGGSSGSDSESSEHTGNGTESHDPDPFNGGSSGSDSESSEHTGNGTESHDPDPFNGGSTNSTESESSSRPSESSSSDSNYIENNSRPSEEGYDSGSSSDSGENYGSGWVSSDPDPF